MKSIKTSMSASARQRVSIPDAASRFMSRSLVGAILILITSFFAPSTSSAGVRIDDRTNDVNAINLTSHDVQNTAVAAPEASVQPLSLDLIHSTPVAESYAMPVEQNIDASATLPTVSASASPAAQGIKIGAARNPSPPLLIPVPTAFSSGLVGLVLLGIGGGIYRAHRRGLLRG